MNTGGNCLAISEQTLPPALPVFGRGAGGDDFVGRQAAHDPARRMRRFRRAAGGAEVVRVVDLDQARVLEVVGLVSGVTPNILPDAATIVDGPQ